MEITEVDTYTLRVPLTEQLATICDAIGPGERFLLREPIFEGDS